MLNNLLARLALLALATWVGAVSATPPNTSTLANSLPPAKRIITLAPHITELLFAAGAGDAVVGTVSRSDHPEQAKALPRVGDGIHLNPESTLILQPDLVIGWLTSATQALQPTLDKLGIPIIYIRPQAVDDIPAAIAYLGQLAGTSAQADAQATRLTRRITALRQQHQRQAALSVMLELGDAPLYAIGNDPLMNDALATCAGSNHFANALQAAPQISLEGLLMRQPDVIITGLTDPGALQRRRDTLAAYGIKAAQQGRIYSINPDLLHRPGPRLIDAIEQLCDHLAEARTTR